MKRTFATICSLAFLSSCNVELTAKHISNNLDITNKSKSGSRENKDTDNTDHSENRNARFLPENLTQCLLTDRANISEAIGKSNITLNQHTIKLVEKDLESFVKKNGRLSPREFWTALSSKTLKKINSALIKEYSHLVEEDYLQKQRLIAYALLTLYESGDENVIYQLNYQSHNEAETKTEVISLGDNPQKMIELKMCELAEFTKMPVTNIIEAVSYVQCAGVAHDTQVDFQITPDEVFELNIKTEKKSYNVKMDLREIELESMGKYNSIAYSLGIFQKPSFSLKMDKNGSTLKELKLKLNRATKIKLNNFKCRTFAAFDFN